MTIMTVPEYQAHLDALPSLNNMFWTSDTHLGHLNILRYCPGRTWETVDEMNEALIANWNARVKPTDSVTLVGDAVLGKLRESLALIGRLNGRKFLVPGNHDRCWTGHKKLGASVELYEEAGFTILPGELDITLSGRRVTVCHFPFTGDSHDEDRHAAFRPKDKGQWLIHGHVHDAWQVRAAEREINVGVDVWGYEPITTDTLLTIMTARS